MQPSPRTISLMQINNSFSGQNYLPYSVGMLEAAYDARMKKVLFLSTGAAYPETGARAAQEDDMFKADPPDVYFAVSSMKRANPYRN